MDDSLRIWRNFSIGSLFDLIMLDTRHYDRDLTVLGGFDGIGGNSAEVDKLVDLENRTMMGFKQEAWFYNQLSESSTRGAAWRVVGNQVVFSRMTLGILSDRPYNEDQWDGYLKNRDRVYQHLFDNKINNTIMLSGDSHASWASDLVWSDGNTTYDKDTGIGAFGVELAGTAVSSQSPIGSFTPNFLANAVSSWLVSHNDELQWSDLYYRGYFEMAITYDSINATYFGMPDITTRNDQEVSLANFLIRNGENRIARNPTVGGGTARSGSLRNGKIN
jgi:alkaline phosphatase D